MKLDSLSQDSQQYKDISRQLQCLVCGVTRRHGMPECDSPELQTCGSRDCSKYFSGGQMQPQTRRGPNTANIPQSYVDLAQKTRDRLRASVPPAAEPSRINTNTLVHHESIIHSQEYEYVVFWQAILLGESAKFSKTFGNGAEKPKGSTFMNELKALILGKFNAEFTGSGQNNQQRIKAEETKFRWHTGRILIAGTEAATVDNFYMMHSKTSADLELYIHNLPAHLSKGNGSKNAKTRKFYLEFAINFQAVRSSTQIHSYF
ncbi:hypothetical protein BT96DRAFT_100793 [Gymnopus androsaceus JB14]|uniref:Uncharacterized protein n=1 Tax=Gymnopus androsaceus JB14 TaxID=1447944 RepID=A0A6A4GCL1_9AGAR|nr:hypothetical protein BT96DRAFT_100793 [Gymnopus androsaceus JB14]